MVKENNFMVKQFFFKLSITKAERPEGEKNI